MLLVKIIRYLFVAVAPIMGQDSIARSTIHCFPISTFDSGLLYRNMYLVCSSMATYEPSETCNELKYCCNNCICIYSLIKYLPEGERQNFLLLLLASTYPNPGKVYWCFIFHSESFT